MGFQRHEGADRILPGHGCKQRHVTHELFGPSYLAVPDFHVYGKILQQGGAFFRRGGPVVLRVASRGADENTSMQNVDMIQNAEMQTRYLRAFSICVRSHVSMSPGQELRMLEGAV